MWDRRSAGQEAAPPALEEQALAGQAQHLGGVGDATEALLREFWANSKNASLKTDATRLRDRVKFGDPFYLAKEYGRGRVTMVTTTAGEQWTDWPSQYPGKGKFGRGITSNPSTRQ